MHIGIIKALPFSGNSVKDVLQKAKKKSLFNGNLNINQPDTCRFIDIGIF